MGPDEMIEPLLVDAVVVCHTEGCENDGVEIPVKLVGPGGLAMCGPCGTMIGDIAILPEEGA